MSVILNGGGAELLKDPDPIPVATTAQAAWDAKPAAWSDTGVAVELKSGNNGSLEINEASAKECDVVLRAKEGDRPVLEAKGGVAALIVGEAGEARIVIDGRAGDLKTDCEVAPIFTDETGLPQWDEKTYAARIAVAASSVKEIVVIGKGADQKTGNVSRLEDGFFLSGDTLRLLIDSGTTNVWTREPLEAFAFREVR